MMALQPSSSPTSKSDEVTKAHEVVELPMRQANAECSRRLDFIWRTAKGSMCRHQDPVQGECR